MRAIWKFLAAALFLAAAGAALAQPRPGREYTELNPARPVSTGQNIEVLEFFYYGCPICYESQPHIARWLLKAGNDVILIRVPAVSSEGWDSFARTYYTLDAMKEVQRLHWPVYDNHHFDGRKLNEEKNLLAWVSSNGVDAKRFAEVWHSPDTENKIKTAQKMLETYSVRGVPTFVVDGRYQTSARMAGGTRQLMEVVDFLVARARRDRALRK
jgi:thiol:disulfide interchange protein DsbA